MVNDGKWWLIIWLVVDLPLRKMMEFVSWDDEIPNWMASHKIHVPNHQPVDGWGNSSNCIDVEKSRNSGDFPTMELISGPHVDWSESELTQS